MSSSTSTGLPLQQHWMLVAVLVILTVFDTVLCAVLLFYFGDVYANYINQATGTVYVCATSVHRLAFYCMARGRQAREMAAEDGRGEPLLAAPRGVDAVVPAPAATAAVAARAAAKPDVPIWVLTGIGVLNGTGNFFQAIGSVHTRGSTQTVLGLIGVPLVVLLSWALLHKRPNAVGAAAAAVIVAATVVSASPTLSGGDDGGGGAVKTYWYSVVIYLCGQVFFATEKVFEEAAFNRFAKLDVLRMFQWTMVVQTLLYFAYYPIQGASAFGGIDVSDLGSVIRDGVRCTGGLNATQCVANTLVQDGVTPCEIGDPGCCNRPECNWHNPFFFFTYCAVDYSTYGLQLYVIQKGGANLVVLASAIALPLSNLAFAIKPILGQFYNPFRATDAVALVLALAGFAAYEIYGKTVDTRKRAAPATSAGTTAATTRAGAAGLRSNERGLRLTWVDGDSKDVAQAADDALVADANA
eukprot:g262.t1